MNTTLAVGKFFYDTFQCIFGIVQRVFIADFIVFRKGGVIHFQCDQEAGLCNRGVIRMSCHDIFKGFHILLLFFIHHPILFHKIHAFNISIYQCIRLQVCGMKTQ